MSSVEVSPAAVGGERGDPTERGMLLLADAKPFHARWTEVNREFLEFVERNPACVDRASFASLYEDDSLRKCSIQPWPFFVGAAQLAEMERVTLGMDRLVKDVVERFLRSDPRQVARFYHTRGNQDGSRLAALDLSETMVALLADEPNGLASAPSRADYLDTRDGLKMLEYNSGGWLGGFETDQLGRLYQEAAPIVRFLDERNRRVRPPAVMDAFFRHVVDDTVRLGVWREGDFNVAMVVRPQDPERVAMHEAADYDGALRRVLAERGMAVDGRVLLCAVDELVVERGGVTLDGHRVHAAVEQHDGTGDIRALFRAMKTGRLNLMSGPVAWLLMDKRNLVLLSEHAGSAEFTAAERDLIDQHLPWTRGIVPGATTFRGRPLRIPEDLVDHREQLVLKKASSLSGRAVSVGRYRTPGEWAADVARAVWEEDWVVQEYLECVPYAFQSGGAVVRHDVVWGLFAFGRHFGGAFMRLAPRGTGGGRVNTSQGAEVGALLEVVE